VGRNVVIPVLIIVGALILGLANSGYAPWLATIIGGALAIAVLFLVLAKIGRGGGG
jgi:hypothetical protein